MAKIANNHPYYTDPQWHTLTVPADYSIAAVDVPPDNKPLWLQPVELETAPTEPFSQRAYRFADRHATAICASLMLGTAALITSGVLRDFVIGSPAPVTQTKKPDPIGTETTMLSRGAYGQIDVSQCVRPKGAARLDCSGEAPILK